MLTDPLTLFDQTIDNLETLAAVLADEIDDRMYAPNAERDGAAVYRVAHGRIGMLLPLLRAARMAQEDLRRSGPPHCLNCD